MATPIRKISKTETTSADIREKASQQLDKALTENADAMVEFIHLVGQLHEKRFLGMANAVLEQGTDILEIVVNQAKRPEYAGGLKNALALVQLLGTVDISALSGTIHAATEAVNRVDRGETDTGGVWKLLGALRDPDVAAGLGMMIEVLRGVGQNLRKEK